MHKFFNILAYLLIAAIAGVLVYSAWPGIKLAALLLLMALSFWIVSLLLGRTLWQVAGFLSNPWRAKP